MFSNASEIRLFCKICILLEHSRMLLLRYISRRLLAKFNQFHEPRELT